MKRTALAPDRTCVVLRQRSAIASAADPIAYPDGRPAARLRMDAKDQGPVLRHGDGPNRCDHLGARDIWAFKAGDTYYMHYDGAGPKGWLACLATSKDLVHWQKKGPVLDLGAAGQRRLGLGLLRRHVFRRQDVGTCSISARRTSRRRPT